MIQRDVERGRSKFDFSQWADGSRQPTQNQIQEICDAVSDGSMPPRGYRLLHRDAKPSPEEIDRLCRWNSAAKSVGQTASASTETR